MSSPTRTDEHRRRRRVRVTPLRAIPVHFAGQRAAEGPLTLGQLSVVGWLSSAPDDPFGTFRGELDIPDGVSVGDVADTIAVLLGRHESLRTTYVYGEHSRQAIAASGTLMLDICTLGEGQWGARDRPAAAEALLRWLGTRPAPRLVELPVRVAVAAATGEDGQAERVVACVAQFSHMSVDHQAFEIVKREFAELIGDRAARQLGLPRHQPLDQATREATPAARRQAELALIYLRDQAMRMPHRLYAKPHTGGAGESLTVELSSVAAAMAAARVAARLRVSRSSIVLAAICAVIACRTGYRQLVLPLLSSNRFNRELLGYVGTLAMSSIATFDVDAESFDALARQTWTSVVEASRHGSLDAVKWTEISRQVEYERGLRFAPEPVFNSLATEPRSMVNAGAVPRPEQIDAALRETELRWRPASRLVTPLRFELSQVDGTVRLEVLSSDSGRVPRPEVESLLLSVERLLVAAAHTNLDAGRIRETIGLEPISRGPNWRLVDSCWVDLAEVQRLLDEALAPAVARIFPAVDGQPLIAYLAATESIHSPEQAHARCMAALADHPTALTPRHYVIFDAAPPDPVHPTAWRTPVAAGPGRQLS